MMRNVVLKRFLQGSSSSSLTCFPLSRCSPIRLSSQCYTVSAPVAENEVESVVFPREIRKFSYRYLTLTGKGVGVKDKAFQNLKPSELQQMGATIAESVSGLPVHVRSGVVGKEPVPFFAQFRELLEQVLKHLSSVSNVFVHDGAIGSSPRLGAHVQVQVISDCPSAVLSLSNVLWDPSDFHICGGRPLMVYVATSVSPGVGDAIGLGSEGNEGFIAGDIWRSSLILCGEAFSVTNGIKEALAALSGCIVYSRGELPLPAWLLVPGDSVILLFAPEETIQCCADAFVSAHAGVILSSEGVAPYFQSGKSDGLSLFKLPAAAVLVTSDSFGVIPPVSSISPGQAAYHFLAGYQNGNFVPAYTKGPSAVDPLELAKAFLSKLQEDPISSFLINVSQGGKSITGKDLVKLVESTLSKNVPAFQAKGGDLQEKYKSFLSAKYQELPEEFTF